MPTSKPRHASLLTAADLRGLPPKEFQTVVVTCRRETETGLWAILTGELRTAAAEAIKTAYGNITTQLEERRAAVDRLMADRDAGADAYNAWDRAYNEFLGWQPRVLRFQQAMLAKIGDFEADTGMTIQQAIDGVSPHHNVATLTALAGAILAHQAGSNDYEPEPQDETLWAALATLTVEVRPGIHVPLTDLAAA